MEPYPTRESRSKSTSPVPEASAGGSWGTAAPDVSGGATSADTISPPASRAHSGTVPHGAAAAYGAALPHANMAMHNATSAAADPAAAQSAAQPPAAGASQNSAGVGGHGSGAPSTRVTHTDKLAELKQRFLRVRGGDAR